MKKKVLAASWHTGGANAIAPVVEQLYRDNLVDIIAISQPIITASGPKWCLKEKLNSCGISCLTTADYGFNDVFSDSAGIDRLLHEEKPNLILTGTSSSEENAIEKEMIAASSRIETPSLAVLDFWGNYSLRFSYDYYGKRLMVLPNKIAIMDKFAEKEMLDEGFEKERMIITGNPHYDNLERKASSFTAEQKADLRKQIGLDAELLLFYAAHVFKKASDEYGYWDLDNIQLINEVMQGLPEDQKRQISTVTKLHPRAPKEDLEAITQYIAQDSRGKIKLVSGDSQEISLASDIALTPFSTVGIEAVYMGKPCISLQPNLKGQDRLAILTKDGIAPVGYTIEGCKELVRKAATDKEYRRELTERTAAFKTDGKATERVTSLVYRMLGMNSCS